jgi:hypothetical protein
MGGAPCENPPASLQAERRVSFRQTHVAGSVVTVFYDDQDQAPPFQERRLEAELRRLFPAGCGVTVEVDLAWSDAASTWRLRRAQVELGGGVVDIRSGLASSLRDAGTPLSVG